MREFKFRAWHKQEGRMFEVFGITDKGSFVLEVVPEQASFEQERGLYDKGDVVLMQFTGLNDKNGKEIYEGDIVKAWIDLGPAGVEQVVYMVGIYPFGTNLQEWTYRAGGCYLPEVIGNIYEHPELLQTS